MVASSPRDKHARVTAARVGNSGEGVIAAASSEEEGRGAFAGNQNNDVSISQNHSLNKLQNRSYSDRTTNQAKGA